MTFKEDRLENEKSDPSDFNPIVSSDNGVTELMK